MPDPTGRWISGSSWQCPVCATVNSADRERCGNCGQSVRPSNEEPIRPVDALDVVGRRRGDDDDADDGQPGPREDVASSPDRTD
jgi:hypothetical protein